MTKVPIRFLPFFSIALTAAQVYLSGCAGQEFPPGGPPDTAPPLVIWTFPDTNAVKVFPEYFAVEFNEYVRRETAEKAIFVSPFLGKLEFSWSGRELTVHFHDTLRQKTTYVVTIGTDVADVNAGNRMAAAYSLAFSTGDSIDNGAIAGRVVDEKPSGIMVFAYLLDNRFADTLDPGHIMPEYATQTGENGVFQLSHLALGTYRLFAIQDEYRNYLYDKGIDRYGVSTGDVRLTFTLPKKEGVGFRLAKEDTSRPFLSSAKGVDRYRVLVRFNEPLDSNAGVTGNYTLLDTLTGTPLKLRASYFSWNSPSIGGVVTDAPMQNGAAYRVLVSGVKDLAGNPIDTAHASFVFLGDSQPDTTKPTYSFGGLRDSISGIPGWQTIDMAFSEPVVESAFTGGLVLLDSTRHSVPVTLRWLSPVDLRITPPELMSNAWHIFQFRMDSLQDLLGNSYRDTTARLRFRTLDLRTTGTIEGTISDVHHLQDTTLIFVDARSVGTQIVVEKRIILRKPGNFRMERVPEGQYVFSAFRDADGSRTYSYGLPQPFSISERFTVSSDTAKVRARWTVSGVVISFP